MKTLSALIALSLLGAHLASAAEPSKDEQQAAVLAKEIQVQQTTIAENQGKIDAKLVTIAEALRLAKIYASRAGR